MEIYCILRNIQCIYIVLTLLAYENAIFGY